MFTTLLKYLGVKFLKALALKAVEALVKHTKTTVDDKALAIVKDALEESGGIGK